MIDLAQAYLGCSKAQLAAALNRDPAKVAPDSGNPKLDMVMGLSDVLDWPAGDVAEALWFDPVAETESDSELAHKSFDELNREAIAAHRDGNHQLMRRLAAQMLRLATTPVERAKAANRMVGAFDRAGRYGKALEWARVAASEPAVPKSSHLLYRANLANSNYAAWNLHEAASIASLVLLETATCAEDDLVQLLARGIAGYVSGNARRRLITLLPEQSGTWGDLALRDLAQASVDLNQLAVLRDAESYRGIANTCRGAEIEIRALRGDVSPQAAAEALSTALSSVIDPSTHPRGDWLESWGWWAVFGLNVATRLMTGEERQRFAAVFSMKAHEIADRLENWAIRERAFTLEHEWRMSLKSELGAEPGHWTLDREDLRHLVGTMGRFPWFRRHGWRILECAKFV